jgi:hypothetical protein
MNIKLKKTLDKGNMKQMLMPGSQKLNLKVGKSDIKVR